MQEVLNLMEEFENTGGQAFFIGGFVRDRIMGMINKDVDLEIFGLSGDVIRGIASNFGTITDSIVDGCGIIKLTMGSGIDVDLCIPRRERSIGDSDDAFVFESDPTLTPQEARSRVDFTMNALLMDRHGNIVDHFGGIKDIHAGIIRHVSDRFVESPVRVLRAMQFAARFDMPVAIPTVQLSATMSPVTIAKERIFEEFSKMFLRGAVPHRGFRFLRGCGWVNHFPVLRDLIGCMQEFRHHPEGDVWNHTLQVIDRMADICTRDNVTGDDRLVLMFAAMLHDIGKPATTIVEDGVIKSPGHAEIGSEMARQFMLDLRAPNDIIDRVVILVREHMSLLDVSATNTRALRRLIRRLGPVTIEDWARVLEADASGRFPLPPAAPGAPFVEVAKTLNITEQVKNPILMGRHLIQWGMNPGPFFGTVLNAAQEAQDNEEFTDLEGAKEWLLKFLHDNPE